MNKAQESSQQINKDVLIATGNRKRLGTSYLVRRAKAYCACRVQNTLTRFYAQRYAQGTNNGFPTLHTAPLELANPRQDCSYAIILVAISYLRREHPRGFFNRRRYRGC